MRSDPRPSAREAVATDTPASRATSTKRGRGASAWGIVTGYLVLWLFLRSVYESEPETAVHLGIPVLTRFSLL